MKIDLTEETSEDLQTKFYGQDVTTIPKDLYIPPEALLLYLENFEGPLDLLLYLIRKAKIDILDIPMADLTRQYLQYIDKMRKEFWSLASEYLVMAATLIDIKSRMLLPKASTEQDALEDEVDPRADLVERLLQYEQFQKAALRLEKLPQAERDFYWINIIADYQEVKLKPEVQPQQFILVWHELLTRMKTRKHLQVKTESLSLHEAMSNILRKLKNTHQRFISFFDLFETSDVQNWVVGFIAILELTRQGNIMLVQNSFQEELYIKADDSPIEV